LHVVSADPDTVMTRARALDATVVHELTDQSDYPSRDFTGAAGSTCSPSRDDRHGTRPSPRRRARRRRRRPLAGRTGWDVTAVDVADAALARVAKHVAEAQVADRVETAASTYAPSTLMASFSLAVVD
jgi:hypothetical protein